MKTKIVETEDWVNSKLLVRYFGLCSSYSNSKDFSNGKKTLISISEILTFLNKNYSSEMEKITI